MGVNDCGIASVTALDSLRLQVTFAPDGGAALPVEADALTTTKWLLTHPGDALLKVALVEKLTDLVYVLWAQHRMTPSVIVVVDSSAIATDLGGWCDSPDQGEAYAGSDPSVAEYLANERAIGPATTGGEPLYASGVITHTRARRHR